MKNHRKEIIAIGDIHGRQCWEKIVERHPDAHFVFLGDYCDPYEQMSRSWLINNLERIIELKRSQPEQVTLLLGNHDLHYFIETFPKSSRYDEGIAKKLKNIFLNDRDLFVYAYEFDCLLFTHAGMSSVWLEKCWHRPLLPSPAACFNHPEKMADGGQLLYTCGPYRYGPDPAGGIFWADEEELENVPKGIIQITGHNGMDNIRHIHSATALKNELAEVFICDCLSQKRYLRITIDKTSEMRFEEMSLTDYNEELIMKVFANSNYQGNGDSQKSQ